MGTIEKIVGVAMQHVSSFASDMFRLRLAL